MVTIDRLLSMSGMPPVILKDGNLGLLLIYPTKEDPQVGIQVYGEPVHRWISIHDLEERLDFSLAEIGAPSMEEIAKKFD